MDVDIGDALEDLMSQIGEFGPYQLRQHILHVLGAFLAGMHMLSLTVIAPTPSHRCYIDAIDNLTSGTSPSFNVSQLSRFIPLKEDGELQSCKKFVHNYSEAASCDDSFVYDNTYYHTSRVIDWNLVCDKSWKRALLQSTYMFGVLTGAIFLGALADKYGRKPLFYLSGVLQLFAGLACAYVTNFNLYLATLFIYGMFGSGGAYVTGFVLTMELMGKGKRTLCGANINMAFCFGVMAVAFWSWTISHYKTLQAVFALHSLLLFGHWWLLDESVRWLWGQGRVKEAIKIVQKAVRYNGKEFVNRHENWLSSMTGSFRECQQQHVDSDPNPNEQTYGMVDLFRTPRLCCRSLIVTFGWFANSLVYYGLSLNTGNLLGNPFLMLFLVGAVEAPGLLLVITLLDRAGRRCLCTTLMFLGGFACIAAAFSPKGAVEGTILVILGKCAISGSFAIMFNYTAELFPTVVRNSAVGMGSVGARFSGMLTPWLSLLGSHSSSLQLPVIIVGGLCITSAVLVLLLPETMNKRTLQSIQDGENFGRDDTGYKTCYRIFCKKRIQLSQDENN